ncbi:MAG: PD-(D/E)XK nuclease family protein [Candidatus Pacebacteria bacterium]|nr:PD-(D/E)XK nuclease family protein [Candidatus Paceibacterota bacterium]
MILKQYEHIEIPKIPELSRQNIAGERYYVNGDGVGYPSMTTVLSIRGKEGIYEWRKRVGNEEANRITKRSTTRGTLFHSLLEQYFLNQITDVDDFKASSMARNPGVWFLFMEAIQELEKKIGKIYCIEDYLYSDEYGIAGAVDMVAEWDGKISVVDFKTSNRELREEWVENYFIQGTGYAKMFTERTGIPCDQLIIFAVPDNGIPQTFIKNVDDYTELLREAIRDYDNHKSKRAA